jgi:hypothetical protein
MTTALLLRPAPLGLVMAVEAGTSRMSPSKAEGKDGLSHLTVSAIDTEQKMYIKNTAPWITRDDQRMALGGLASKAAMIVDSMPIYPYATAGVAILFH